MVSRTGLRGPGRSRRRPGPVEGHGRGASAREPGRPVSRCSTDGEAPSIPSSSTCSARPTTARSSRACGSPSRSPATASASRRRSGAPSPAPSARPGRRGFARNLEPWEIVEQVLTVRRESPDRPVTGVVFQGQGEPFQNYDNVIRAAAAPAPSLRRADRRRSHHDLHRGPRPADRALHGRGPSLSPDPLPHLGVLGEAGAAHADHPEVRGPRAGRGHAPPCGSGEARP